MGASAAPVDQRLAMLKVGEPLAFSLPPQGREESPEERAARTIPSTWLEGLATPHTRDVTVPINISHAIITGAVDLQYANFTCDIRITDCQFENHVKFSFANFKRLVSFEGTKFNMPADFRGAKAESDFVITRATFADKTTFNDLQINQLLQASGARFGSVTFERMVVSKAVLFGTVSQGNRTFFQGETIFRDSEIKGFADSRGHSSSAMSAFTGFE